MDLEDYEDTEVIKALWQQLQIGLFSFLCGILGNWWTIVQQTYLNNKESRKCRKKWASQLSIKLIEIVQDMWTHRNDILHGKKNAIQDQLHDKINALIEQTCNLIQSYLWLFSPAEQRFCNGATIEQIQQQSLQGKKQWIKKTSSIIKSFWKCKMNNPSTQMLYKAMGVITNPETSDVQYQSLYQNMILEEWTKISDVRSASPAHESVQCVFWNSVSIVVLLKAFRRPCVNFWVFLFSFCLLIILPEDKLNYHQIH